ncbi:MAG: ATP-grasp domain-containing protein [Candidatus Omnitrophica bacterium]|jgi:D-alanine-D-alanine ligase and related ATP-grasp enzymes|nr:ATP-grasp domain-containing protein [Candidatus Omnitrophota bacterium]
MKKTSAVTAIGITFNLKKKNVCDDRYEEYDEIETIAALENEIKRCGFRVIRLEQNAALAEKLRRERPDFVFNIAEGLGAARSRESQVPCLLEGLGIPYSGSDPLALGVTLDKYLTHVVLNHAGVPVPRMVMFSRAADIDGCGDIFKTHKRFLVKPRWEGSSKGIFLDSLVSDMEGLRKRSAAVISAYHQPAVAEEFITGDEVTVGICGNKAPRVIGMMRIVPRDAGVKHFVYSQEVKRDWRRQVEYVSGATLPKAVQSRIQAAAIRAFAALELRDISRIDFRIDGKGLPRVIDVNPLPGLSPVYSDLCILCRLHKKSYPWLIRAILREALQRCGLRGRKRF